MRSPMELRAFCRVRTCALWLMRLAYGGQIWVGAAEDDWLFTVVKRESVNSTNLRSIGYHRGLRVLEIEFHSGSIYRYREVPLNAYAALIRADSKGRHFSRQIRGRYEFKRMDGTQ